jgi:hypothetical protein
MAVTCFNLLLALAAATLTFLPLALALPTGLAGGGEEDNGWNRVDNSRTNRPNAGVSKQFDKKLHGADDNTDPRVLYGPDTLVNWHITPVEMTPDWRPYEDGYSNVIQNDLNRFPKDVKDEPFTILPRRTDELDASKDQAQHDSIHDVRLLYGPETKVKNFRPKPIEMSADWKPYQDGYSHVISHDLARFMQDQAERVTARADLDKHSKREDSGIHIDPAHDPILVADGNTHFKGPYKIPIDMGPNWHPYPDGYKHVIEHDLARFEAKQKADEAARKAYEHPEEDSSEDVKHSNDDSDDSTDEDDSDDSIDKQDTDDSSDEHSKRGDKNDHSWDNGHPDPTRDPVLVTNKNTKFTGPYKIPIKMSADWHPYPDGYTNVIEHDLARFSAKQKAAEVRKQAYEHPDQDPNKDPHSISKSHQKRGLNNDDTDLSWQGKPFDAGWLAPQNSDGEDMEWAGRWHPQTGPDRVTKDAYMSWDRNPALRASYSAVTNHSSLDTHPHTVDPGTAPPTRDPAMPEPEKPHYRPVPHRRRRRSELDPSVTADPREKDFLDYDTEVREEEFEEEFKKEHEEFLKYLAWSSGQTTDQVAEEAKTRVLGDFAERYAITPEKMEHVDELNKMLGEE